MEQENQEERLNYYLVLELLAFHVGGGGGGLNLPVYFTPYTRIKFRWTKKLNV